MQIALPVFEGPLDLLLHLIKQNKIDIYDIPIALITKQYLEYLEFVKELDLNIASEFLLMAATLIYIKSRMLLPRQEMVEEEDPRQELVEKLIEYQKFKEVSQILKERYKVWSMAFPRKTSKEEEFFLQELSISDLLTAVKKLFETSEPKIYITKEYIKVEDKIEEIMDLLKIKKSIAFNELFRPGASKLEIIITFLALLELLRLRVIKACQERPFGKILINLEERNADRDNL